MISPLKLSRIEPQIPLYYQMQDLSLYKSTNPNPLGRVGVLVERLLLVSFEESTDEFILTNVVVTSVSPWFVIAYRGWSSSKYLQHALIGSYYLTAVNTSIGFQSSNG
jgi:hypothetical protein